MKLSTKHVLELDPVWVDQILDQAFDEHRGGANHWADAYYTEIKPRTRGLHISETAPLWIEVELTRMGETRYLNITNLTPACEWLMNGQVPGHAAEALALLEAFQQRELSMIDADLADIIVQVALFSEVRY